MLEKQPYKVVENDGVRLSIYVDEDADSPRIWDTLGTMICWHRKHSIGDKHNFQCVEEFTDYLSLGVGIEVEDGYGITDEQREELEKHIILIPIYLLDHSGISISTNPFNCKWDSRQIGYIYVLKKDAAKELGILTTLFDQQKVEEILVGEVKDYNDYLTGNVYRYELEIGQQCNHCKHVVWECVSTGCGFLGEDFEANGLKDCILNDGEQYITIVNLI